jgi:hypothetical protein
MTRTTGLFWIASSDQDIAKARAVLRALKPAGVLDELGFLVLLGAFSDRLYPAISTIMTRARYFLLVPAIYRYIEALPVGRRRNPEKLARDLQVRLCQSLMETDQDQAGIIGKRSNGNVQRLPSSVYWFGLTTLGIALHHQPESSYLRDLARRPSRSRYADDDGITHEGEHEGFWDSEAPSDGILQEDGAFAKGLSLRLTRREATYLRNCFLVGNDGHDSSLLGHLLREGTYGISYDAPWSIPELPAVLGNVVQHAKLLSLLARGAQLQYEALLFEARRLPDSGTGDAFATWWHEATPVLALWNLDEFAKLPFLRHATMRGDVHFLRTWRAAVIGKRSAASAYGDRDARALLRARESAIRGVKARLNSTYHLDQWQPPASYDPRRLHALSYRHGIGTTVLNDIADGLNRGGKA